MSRSERYVIIISFFTAWKTPQPWQSSEWSFLKILRPFGNISLLSMFEVNQDSVHVYHAKQKHITPERLNSPYLLRTMLGFFSRRTRPIRSTENYFAQTVVIVAPLGPDQSERSKFSLDQSESRISPM